MSRDLRALADYLQSWGVTHVAMEATGVLWKPVWNVLDGRFTLLLVNPRHLKKVPGRKTDVSDAQWIAQLLECGLLQGSFVPPRPVRELRDLTRHRAQLTAEHTRVANRVHKLLEDTNVKLGAVASDVLGVSGRMMLRAMLNGETDAGKLADLALGKLREKIPQLRLALEGHCTEHHRFLLRRLLSHLNYLESQIEEFSKRIGPELDKLLSVQKQQRLDAIPGIGRISIENVIAEIGPDMGVFPDEHHLSSWTGICPGNEESAGKRLRSRTRKGNRWLRRALAEAAWAASHKKDSLSGGTIPAAGNASWEEACVAGSRSQYREDHLSHAQEGRGVQGSGCGVFRPPSAGTFEALSGQTLGTSGLQDHVGAEQPGR